MALHKYLEQYLANNIWPINIDEYNGEQVGAVGVGDPLGSFIFEIQ